MPDAQSILTNLRLIANDRIGGAVAWHVAVALCGLALALGWRPSRRLTGLLLSAPVASVGIVAFMHGNPFNGAISAPSRPCLRGSRRGSARTKRTEARPWTGSPAP